MKFFKVIIIPALLLAFPALAENNTGERLQNRIEKINSRYENAVEKINSRENMPSELKTLLLSQAAEHKDLAVSHANAVKALAEKHKSAREALKEKLKAEKGADLDSEGLEVGDDEPFAEGPAYKGGKRGPKRGEHKRGEGPKNRMGKMEE